MSRYLSVLVAIALLPLVALSADLGPQQWSAATAPVSQLDGCAAHLEVLADNTARATFYVNWTYYRKNNSNGRVTRISSGSVGFYSTRREAQSVVDDYLGSGSRSGGYYYYYSARVSP